MDGSVKKASSSRWFDKVLLFISVPVSTAILVMFSARFFVDRSDGLAGGAVVLVYGMVGLILGIVVAAAIVRWLPKHIRLIWAVLLVSNALFFTYAYLDIRKERLEQRDTAVPPQPLPKKTVPVE